MKYVEGKPQGASKGGYSIGEPEKEAEKKGGFKMWFAL